MFRSCKKSGFWSLNSNELGELVFVNDDREISKPLYYLIEYNRLDLLIAVKNKNIHDDLM